MNIQPRLQPYLIASIACLALVGFAAQDLYRERERSVQEQRSNTANLARLVEENARQGLRRVQSLLDDGVRSVQLAGAALGPVATDAARLASLQAVQADLRALLPNDGFVRGFEWLDAKGEVSLTTLAPAARMPGPLADRDWFMRLRLQPLADTAYGRLEGPFTLGWRLPVARRLLAADGSFAGALVALVDPATLQPVLDAIDTGRNGFVTLFLTDGWMVATAPRNEALYARNWLDTPMFKQHLPSSPVGTVQQVVVRDKTERVYSYRALIEYPLVVSVGVSMTDALADWRARAVWDSVLLAVVSSALLAGAVAMSRAHARREAAEAALAESARRTAAILDHAADGIVTLGADGLIESANMAGAAMFGQGAAALVGRHVSELVPSFSPPSTGDAMAWPLDDQRIESTGRRQDGSEFAIDIAVTEATRQGQPLRVALMRDITDSKKAQAAVARALERAEQSERFLRAITDNLPLRVAYVDRALRYVFVNRAHCLRYGLEREAVLGRTRQELRGKAPSGRLMNFMEQALAGHEQRFQIDEIQDGEARTFETVLVPDITAQGGVLGFYAASTDVTEPLVQQRRIEVALAERETLLREVYHRVKNNLQVVQSLLSLQRRGLPEGEARAALDESIRRVHAMALVHEKLYQSGTLSAVSLHDYTHELLRHLGETGGAGGRAITLRAEIDSVEAELETAVPYGLLVAELVGNALKHGFPGQRGGSVCVSLRRGKDEEGEMGAKGEKGCVTLCVTDDGVGLPAGFDMAQIHSMGLQLACSLATQLGGSLHASNEAGAVFSVQLPRLG